MLYEVYGTSVNNTLHSVTARLPVGCVVCVRCAINRACIPSNCVFPSRITVTDLNMAHINYIAGAVHTGSWLGEGPFTSATHGKVTTLTPSDRVLHAPSYDIKLRAYTNSKLYSRNVTNSKHVSLYQRTRCVVPVRVQCGSGVDVP
jgi:hypothetical protein